MSTTSSTSSLVRGLGFLAEQRLTALASEAFKEIQSGANLSSDKVKAQVSAPENPRTVNFIETGAKKEQKLKEASMTALKSEAETTRNPKELTAMPPVFDSTNNKNMLKNIELDNSVHFLNVDDIKSKGRQSENLRNEQINNQQKVIRKAKSGSQNLVKLSHLTGANAIISTMLSDCLDVAEPSEAMGLSMAGIETIEADRESVKPETKVVFPPYKISKAPLQGSSRNQSAAKPTPFQVQTKETARSRPASKIKVCCAHCGGGSHGVDVAAVYHNIGCVCRSLDVSARMTGNRLFKSATKKNPSELKLNLSTIDPKTAHEAFDGTAKGRSNYLEFLLKQLQKTEKEHLEHKRRCLQAESQIQSIRREICQVRSRDPVEEQRDPKRMESMLLALKEQRLRQKRIREVHEQTMIETAREHKRFEEKENELIEDLLTERRTRIMENITRIKNRNELRAQQNRYADQMLIALKRVQS